MKKTFLYFWLITMGALAMHVHAQSMLAEQRFEHLGITVYAEHSSLQAGMTTTLAFRLRHDPHWHTYWKYPGDSGLPSKLKLRIGAAPAIAAQLQWPTPEPLDVGGIHNVGYNGELWLLADVAVPANAQQTLQLAAELSWLVCREECIPGRGEFVLQLPVADVAVLDAAHREVFAKARAALPSAAPADWLASFALDAAQIRFTLDGDLAPFEERGSNLRCHELQRQRDRVENHFGDGHRKRNQGERQPPMQQLPNPCVPHDKPRARHDHRSAHHE